MSLIRLFVTITLCAALGGCSNWLVWEEPPKRQAQNQSPPEAEPTPERPVGPTDYLVHRGDTVYSIAFRANLDYRELARWNAIGSDYLIRPGQVLRLRMPAPTQLVHGDIVSTPTPLEGPPSSAPTPLISDVPPSTAPPPIVSSGMRRKSSRRSPAAIPPPVPVIPTRSPESPPLIAAVEPESIPPLITSESGGPYKWQWPTNGVVVRGYDLSVGAKGLDFAGTVGQPVVAAAPGKVVYSGGALKGYGELVIIKHDDLRLSAYGYNRTRLVTEGQMVDGGQMIAELGLGPENKPILHFEIRERGQPVNPIPYLPAKTARN